MTITTNVVTKEPETIETEVEETKPAWEEKKASKKEVSLAMDIWAKEEKKTV